MFAIAGDCLNRTERGDSGRLLLMDAIARNSQTQVGSDVADNKRWKSEKGTCSLRRIPER
jgi:hypothetical protein